MGHCWVVDCCFFSPPDRNEDTNLRRNTKMSRATYMSRRIFCPPAARFHPFRLTLRSAHHCVVSRKTAPNTMKIDPKVLAIKLQSVHVCKLHLFFERWTIADAVHKVEPLDPLSDTQTSPVTSNAWCRLLLWPLSSRTAMASLLPVWQLHADGIFRGATSLRSV